AARAAPRRRLGSAGRAGAAAGLRPRRSRALVAGSRVDLGARRRGRGARRAGAASGLGPERLADRRQLVADAAADVLLSVVVDRDVQVVLLRPADDGKGLVQI